MDNLVGSSQQSKEAEKAKSKKKKKSNKLPIKVVYISNPMKVKTSASKFRALVQELTGQDAELPDPTKFTDTHGSDGGGGKQMVPDASETSGAGSHPQEVSRVVVEEGGGQYHHDDEQSGCRSHGDVPLESLDEVFTPQMLETLAGIFPPGLFL